MKKFGITIIGDSIIYNRYKRKIFNCAKYLKKDLLKKKNFNFLIKKKTIHGGSSEDILNLLPNYLFKLKLKYKNIIIVQIGINDSWHYKSLGGKPNVSKKKFLYNLGLIDRLRKKYKFKSILFLSYHSIKKRRIEINGKSINQNLMSYNSIINNFCKKKKLLFLNMEKIFYRKKNINFLLPDGIHLNNEGVKIYSEKISNFLIKKINEKNL